MADNYLENQYEAYLARKAAKEKKKKLLFKKQLGAYKRRIKDAAQSSKESDNPTSAQ